MTALAVAPSLFDPRGREPTLDELLVDAWEGLTTHRIVECPACQSEMTPEYGAHMRPIGGRCTACGLAIS